MRGRCEWNILISSMDITAYKLYVAPSYNLSNLTVNSKKFTVLRKKTLDIF